MHDLHGVWVFRSRADEEVERGRDRCQSDVDVDHHAGNEAATKAPAKRQVAGTVFYIFQGSRCCLFAFPKKAHLFTWNSLPHFTSGYSAKLLAAGIQRASRNDTIAVPHPKIVMLPETTLFLLACPSWLPSVLFLIC